MPARRRLIWKLYPIGVVVMLTAIALVTWYADGAFRDFYYAQTQKDLAARTSLITRDLTSLLGEDALERPDVHGVLDRLADYYGEAGGMRVTVIALDGSVLGESNADSRRMENHANRPEIRAALNGEARAEIRHSESVGVDMMYFAMPLRHDGRVVGVVRTAVPLSDLNAALWAVYRRVAIGGVAVALLASLVGLFLFARLVGHPLEQIKQSAARFADGDLSYQIEAPASEELGGLAESLNRMAQQLDEKIRTVTRQSHEQQAMLASMIEGVLAVDADERILSMNGAAGDLLRIGPGSIGRKVQEVVRNTQLQRFIERTLSSREPVEGDLSLPGDDEDRHLQASGTLLRDAGGRAIGALVVLNDVTRLRRLESVRRDFVANVSHELKTPVTSIKGFIETIRDGALEDRAKTEEFLAIISRQADRLSAIIDDLLKLSRIEQDAEKGGVELTTHRLRDVLQSAIADTAALASEKQVAVRLDCRPDLTARVNAPLIEQAVVNLLDNAIKYSGPGTAVEVTAEGSEKEFRITVRDNGVGIPAEHLPRLFERFYRVDKARSRKQGGTGLGLAIVKHIAQAHRGSVSVQSAVGRGSAFTLHLPVPAPAESPATDAS